MLDTSLLNSNYNRNRWHAVRIDGLPLCATLYGLNRPPDRMLRAIYTTVECRASTRVTITARRADKGRSLFILQSTTGFTYSNRAHNYGIVPSILHTLARYQLLQFKVNDMTSEKHSRYLGWLSLSGTEDRYARIRPGIAFSISNIAVDLMLAPNDRLVFALLEVCCCAIRLVQCNTHEARALIDLIHCHDNVSLNAARS